MRAAYKLSVFACAVMASLWSATIRADDIDLYTGGEQITGAETNVLLILDNSANWSNTSGWPATQGEAELNALKTLIDSLNDSVNLGVMMHTASGSTHGAYVRFAMRPMNAENRARLKEVFDDIASTAPNAPQDKVSQSQVGDNTLEEAYRYFAGLSIGTSVLDAKRDYGGNTLYYDAGGGVSTTLEAKAHPASRNPVLGSFAYDNASDLEYNGPSSASLGCAKNYIIWIGNTSLAGTTNTSRLQAVASALNITPTAADLAQITTYSGVNSAPQGVMLDEWARFMNKYGVESLANDPSNPTQKLRNPIITYTVDVFPAATPPAACIGDTSGGAQQVGQHYVMQSVATAGGGRCLPGTNTDQLKSALNTIFAEIQAVNSQFASAALPVSVNARGTFENQVYIGVFRPDSSARPRWYGNLKGYKFGGFCDWNRDGIVDANEAVSEAVGNKADACKKYCEVDGVAGFTYGVDIGVNDPDQAAAICAAVDSNLLDSTGTPLPSSVATLAIERYDIFLSDKNGNLAEDQTGGTGFISQDAISYWTHASDFWNFLQTTAAGASDMPDGPFVERGGAAQRLRDQLVDAASTTPLAKTSNRRTYTCLGCTSTFDSFSTGNAALVTRLTRTLTSHAITSLARVGDTVTVTAPGHNLANGTQVQVSGTSVAAYNALGAVTVANANTGAGTFQFTVTGLEKPPTQATGSGSLVAARAITSITYLAGGQGQVAGDVSGLTAGSQVNIAGAGAYFNGVSTVLDVGAGTFTYRLKLPQSPATTPGSTTAGPKAYANTAVTLLDSQVPPVVKVTTSTNLTAGAEANRFEVGDTVTLAGVTPTDYNGTRTIIACPAGQGDAQSYCFSFPVTAAAGATFSPLDVLFGLQVERTLGATILSARLTNTTVAALGITNGNSITVSQTGQAQYDKAFFVGAVDSATNTFRLCNSFPCEASGTVTLSPATPAAGGTVTVVLGRYVPPTTLINWILGQENGTEDENSDGYKQGWRASVHGDVLHSRPLLVNYDDPATPAVELGIVGFYGGNDGFLRAIKAGTTDNDGKEIWSFIPEEFIPDPTSNDGIKRLYHNDKQILYPNLACNLVPTPEKRTYFWDGVIAQNTGATELMSDKRIIYANMRRGGRAMYALDVTLPSNFQSEADFVPQLAWKVTHQSNPSGAVNELPLLGQTWSEPRVAVVRASGGTRIPILVMGGGYDTSEDDLPPGSTRGTGTVGRGVYIINPETGPSGGLLHLQPPATYNGQNITRKYSIPADVTLIDTDNDGDIDRIYAIDSGGNVFRWTWNAAVGNPYSAAAWTFKWVANLQSATPGARKFLSRMAFMPVAYKGVPGYALLFGSGDRERPLANFRVESDSTSANYLSCVAVEPACASYYPNGYYGTAIRDLFFSVTDIDAVPVDNAGTPEFAYPLTIANLHDVVQTVSGQEVVASYSDSTGKQGWFLELLNNQIKLARNGQSYSCTAGEEKMVDVPIFSGGYVRFATNSPQQPDPGSGVCSNLGQAREYAINPLTGLAAGVADGDQFSVDNFSTVVAGGGLPPSITSGVVQIGERFVKFDTRGAGGTARDPVNASSRRNKVYWFYRAD